MSVVAPEQSEVQAVAKWVRISPRKARLVIDHIRGRTVPEARTVLAFTTRAAAREIDKVLRSAVANAEANHGLDGDELVVSDARVDDGLTIKRWKPRARGRVARIKKRTCHITIKVAPLGGGAVPPPVKHEIEEAPEPEAEEAPEREDAETAEGAEAVEEEAAAEAEEAPKPESAGAPTPEEQAAAATEEEPKPKRRRARRKKEEEE
jgi:large subunit ribosomal protein L22